MEMQQHQQLPQQKVQTAAAAAIERQKEGPLFLRKTFAMIEQCTTENPSLASWSEEGTSFYIKSATPFAAQIIPKFFRHSKLSSFVRQLNFYGFKKVKAASNSGQIPSQWAEFAHPQFVRDSPHMLAQIHRAAHYVTTTDPAAAGTTATMEGKVVQQNTREVLQLKSEVTGLKARLQSMTESIATLTEQVRGLTETQGPDGHGRVVGKKRRMALSLSPAGGGAADEAASYLELASGQTDGTDGTDGTPTMIGSPTLFHAHRLHQPFSAAAANAWGDEPSAANQADPFLEAVAAPSAATAMAVLESAPPAPPAPPLESMFPGPAVPISSALAPPETTRFESLDEESLAAILGDETLVRAAQLQRTLSSSSNVSATSNLPTLTTATQVTDAQSVQQCLSMLPAHLQDRFLEKLAANVAGQMGLAQCSSASSSTATTTTVPMPSASPTAPQPNETPAIALPLAAAALGAFAHQLSAQALHQQVPNRMTMTRSRSSSGGQASDLTTTA